MKSKGKLNSVSIKAVPGACRGRKRVWRQVEPRHSFQPMPTMAQTALSDCSYPESTIYNIRDEIDSTITRLKVVIDEEASLRKALRALFVKRREEAIEQVRLANVHLDSVNEEEAAFREDLKQATATANKVRGSV
jgi:hypothetical protein